MNLLALDTSTSTAFVALYYQGKFFELHQDIPQQHALRILPMVDELLQKVQIKPGELDGIVFGQGPGSFTGLRIAASVAQGLAVAHDLPVYPVSTLRAICEAIPAPEPVLAVIDARMNEVYWTFRDEKGMYLPEQVSSVKDIQLPTLATFTLAGIGFEAYFADFNPQLLGKIKQKKVLYPQAKAMLALVLAGAIKPVNAADALPVYIRNHATQ